MNLPWRNSFAADVAAIAPAESRAQLFIADRDGIYSRYKSSDDPYSAYGRWQRVAAIAVSRLSVGVRGDGTLEISAIDGKGALIWAAQSSAALGAPFGNFEQLALPDNQAIADMDYGSTDHTPVLYAVSSTGSLWKRTPSGVGSEGDWIELSDSSTPKLTTVAAVERTNMLFAVAAGGGVFSFDPASGWLAMP